MNKFLQTRKEVDEATKYLQDNGLVESGISCKNWEVWQIIPYMKDGDWLDLGSDGGVVLDNLVRKNINGKKVGVDLAYPESETTKTYLNGFDKIKGDLMDTGLPTNSFDYITCLSVIEHEVDFEKLAKECSRLLRERGEAFVSFDFWQPKPDTSKMKLYKLDWNVLDKQDVLDLVQAFKDNGMALTGDIDFTVSQKVINDTYCSPAAGVSYTFGIVSFVKR